ncbi:MAG TPA: DUF3108 domain-containing protein [Oligoflexia bacterium]|nr:DUF3108 domain-containing protein [Oligoflexia bacterium]HMP48238.1 DUF3108 domain-containing protein [Oligoflexia bacterium]
MKNPFILSMLIIGSVFFPLFSSADYIDPSTVNVSTESYKPSFTDFAEGTYQYDIKWQGLQVANGIVQVESAVKESNKMYAVEAKANTSKLIDVLYKLRHTSGSEFDGETLRPIKFHSVQTENSKSKKTDIYFREDGHISSVSMKNGKVENRHEFASSNLTLDPISAAFLARSIPVNVGSTAEFDVFNGKNRFLISFRVDSLEKVVLPGSDVAKDAFKVIPSVKKLTDTEGETRFRKAEIWISADEKRDVLKVESEVLVGKVSAFLKSFDPVGSFEKPGNHDLSKPEELSIAKNLHKQSRDSSRASLGHVE